MSTEERVKLSVAVQEKFDAFDPRGFDARLAMHVAAEWIDDLAALNNGQGAWRALTDRLRELAGPDFAAPSPETGTAAVPTHENDEQRLASAARCQCPRKCYEHGTIGRAVAGPAPEPVKPPECGHVYGNRVCVAPAGHDREGGSYRSHAYVDTIWANSRRTPAAGTAPKGEK